MPDEQTRYSSRREGDVDALAWPMFSEHALDHLLRSAGAVLHPGAGDVLWEAGALTTSTWFWRDHALERDVLLDLAGLFLMIGADPRTTWLADVGVELDAKGFVATRDGFATSVPGVFAVGDARAGSVKRVASAVG